MEIELLSGNEISHVKARFIRIRDGNKVFNIEQVPGGIVVKMSDNSDSLKR